MTRNKSPRKGNFSKLGRQDAIQVLCTVYLFKALYDLHLEMNKIRPTKFFNAKKIYTAIRPDFGFYSSTRKYYLDSNHDYPDF